jgi:hypothetical protein
VLDELQLTYTSYNGQNLNSPAVSVIRGSTVLTSSCLSVRPRAWSLVHTGRILIKFYIWAFFQNLSRNSSFITRWQKLRVLYMKTFSHVWQYLAEFILEWELFQMTWRTRVARWIRVHACTHAHTHTHKYAILVFHSNSCFVNAPQCYIIRTLPLFYLVTGCISNTSWHNK